MRYSIFSHCGGGDAIPSAHLSELKEIISNTKIKLGKGAARAIRESLLGSLKANGWSSEVVVSRDSEITITSAKNKIGLCLQTGNMARIYADILKLQTLYMSGSISAGVIILPSPPAAKVMGSNIANSARLENELRIFRKVIHMPIALISIE